MEKFREKIIGRLMWADIDPNTRFRYQIWFDYTRKLISQVREGDLVVAPNFTSGENVRWSILQLINVMPRHYALGTDAKDLKGFPGFVMQAAKSASADWTEQETESYEDTTKIICEAIPANLEFKDEEEPKIIPESTMPMIGKDVRVLSSDMTEKIFNGGLSKNDENIIVVGHLARDKNVEILIRTEDMIKTHFGIFGFTGVGKSNFISSTISKLLSTNRNVKIVLFDLVDEYVGLLIDQILNEKINTKIVCLGKETLIDPVFEFINNPNDGKLADVSNLFLDNLLLPKGLRNKKESYKPAIKTLLKENKIKIFEERITRTLEDFLSETWNDVIVRLTGVKKKKLEEMRKNIFDQYTKEELTPELAKELVKKLGFGEGGAIMGVEKSTAEILEDSALRERIEFNLVHPLKEIIGTKHVGISSKIKISLSEILRDLNITGNSSLYIITSHDPNKVRVFASRLGNSLYRARREHGIISPLVSFVFDEGDQFIPLLTSPSSTYATSKASIENLTRRGRKFGIGVGIATQRSVYLDTNIMGQLHTYFISKLPRKSDRERVGEAFSLAEDQFTQTFKFLKGQWLLVSHDAAGIDIPIPIQAPNAEDRIKKFLNVKVSDTHG